MTDNYLYPETYSEDYPTNYTNGTLNQTLSPRFTDTVSFYYTPVLIVLGSIGNLVSVFVFYSSKLRLQSTSQYLSALAISDTLFLFQLLPPWLNAAHLSDLFNREGFCQIFIYVTYVTSCLSAWLVVAFTVERFVAVLYPLQRNAIYTVTRARHIIISIVLAALLLNVPILRFAKGSENGCSINYDYLDYAARFNLIDTIVTFTVPLIVIVIMNTWIMIGVWRLERARHLLLKAAAGGAAAGPPRLHPCPRSQQRVTRMLLIVSSVFVVFNLPAYTVRILAYTYDKGEVHESLIGNQQVALMFFNTNFGINFILYCLSGQNFRRALRQAIPWLRRRARRGVAVRRATSCHPARASSVSTSYVSNCTEATNYSATVSTPRRREAVISRWTFDNNRQRQAIENLELQAIPVFKEM